VTGNLPGLRWSETRTVQGTPPIGEVETACIGCRRRFVSGEQFRARVVGPLSFPVFAHPDCAELLDVSAA
jgi:hypothetical protein